MTRSDRGRKERSQDDLTDQDFLGLHGFRGATHSGDCGVGRGVFLRTGVSEGTAPTRPYGG